MRMPLEYSLSSILHLNFKRCNFKTKDFDLKKNILSLKTKLFDIIKKDIFFCRFWKNKLQDFFARVLLSFLFFMQVNF
jgi:hypothetical protein